MPKKEGKEESGSKGQDNDKKSEKNQKSNKKKSLTGCVGNKSPGPARYILPSLMGYPKHDITKYRNPAYSFRARQNSQMPCVGPGPKYGVVEPARYPAFTIGSRGTSMGTKSCTPGPYKLPENRPFPAFTIRGRTNPRTAGCTPAPYNLPPAMGCHVPNFTASPCFTFGARPCGMKCDASPGPKFGPMKLDAVKPRAPMFSIAARQTGSAKSCGPGPKYKYCYGCFKCAPKFTFGIRHSDCAPPLITECDEKC